MYLFILKNCNNVHIEINLNEKYLSLSKEYILTVLLLKILFSLVVKASII